MAIFTLQNIKKFKNKIITESVNLHPKWIEHYKAKLKYFSELTGEERISRIAVDPKDGSSYQTFASIDSPRNPSINIKDIINENTYIISDLHFGKGDKNNDIKNIKLLNKIPENEVLLILGDIGYIKTPCKQYVKDLFKNIKCKNIYMILGNHDCYYLDYYYDDLGIKGIYDKIYIPEKNWIFSHQPCNGPKDGLINFHGHIHEKKLEEGDPFDIDFSGILKDVKNKINCWEGYCKRNPRTLKGWINWKMNEEK